MHSTRFGLPVVLTEHARLRMAERNMDTALVLKIIDTAALSKTLATATTGCISTCQTGQTTCFAWPL